MAIFNEADEYGDRLIVSQYENGNYFFEANLDVIIEFSPEQSVKLAGAIYAREAERFKESM